MYTYKAKVRSVYDGDTFRADIDLGFGIINKGNDGKGEIFRLYGIDTPEVRGEERPEGLKVRDYVRGLMPEGKQITINSIKDKKGKYGRYLAIVIIEDDNGNVINLTNDLIEKNFGEQKEY